MPEYTQTRVRMRRPQARRTRAWVRVFSPKFRPVVQTGTILVLARQWMHRTTQRIPAPQSTLHPRAPYLRRRQHKRGGFSEHLFTPTAGRLNPMDSEESLVKCGFLGA